jgi:argonaute-like protein implicated in RNA metabolism and viral defense
MVRIFDEEIGDREWKRKLASDKGLFERIPYKAPVTGPYLARVQNKETIQGDTMTIEENIFDNFAKPFQKRFHEQLEKEDPEKAKEYLLTIIKATDKWKKDVGVLQNFLGLLRQEEGLFKEEERKIEVVEELQKHLPAIIEKHIPEAFETIKGHLNDMDRFISDLEFGIRKMHDLEKFISDYLEFLKEHMGFLFE